MPLHRVLVLTLLCLTAALARAAGFSPIAVAQDRDGPALHGGVWTPCAAPAGPITLGWTIISAVRDCPLAHGRYVLVVISHGYGGSYLGHHDTAEALADAGFVVAAISHSDDNYQVRGQPGDSARALATRTTDIRRLIDYMTEQWQSHAELVADRVGFFGFSRGGYTGLVLAGARPDFEKLPRRNPSACTLAPQGEPCTRERQGFRDLLASPLVHDTRIKAAVIADPLSMVFDADGLKGVTIPIQLWSSAYGGDGVTPEDVAAVRSNLPSPPDWHVAGGAAHFGFLAPCSPAQLQQLAQICRDDAGFDRVAFHKELDRQAAQFLQRWLQN